MLDWETQMEIARSVKEYERQRKEKEQKIENQPFYGDMKKCNDKSRLTLYIIVMLLCIFLEDCLMAWIGVTLIYFMTKPKNK